MRNLVAKMQGAAPSRRSLRSYFAKVKLVKSKPGYMPAQPQTNGLGDARPSHVEAAADEAAQSSAIDLSDEDRRIMQPFRGRIAVSPTPCLNARDQTSVTHETNFGADTMLDLIKLWPQHKIVGIVRLAYIETYFPNSMEPIAETFIMTAPGCSSLTIVGQVALTTSRTKEDANSDKVRTPGLHTVELPWYTMRDTFLVVDEPRGFDIVFGNTGIRKHYILHGGSPDASYYAATVVPAKKRRSHPPPVSITAPDAQAKWAEEHRASDDLLQTLRTLSSGSSNPASSGHGQASSSTAFSPSSTSSRHVVSFSSQAAGYSGSHANSDNDSRSATDQHHGVLANSNADDQIATHAPEQTRHSQYQPHQPTLPLGQQASQHGSNADLRMEQTIQGASHHVLRQVQPLNTPSNPTSGVLIPQTAPYRHSQPQSPSTSHHGHGYLMQPNPQSQRQPSPTPYQGPGSSHPFPSSATHGYQGP